MHRMSLSKPKQVCLPMAPKVTSSFISCVTFTSLGFTKSTRARKTGVLRMRAQLGGGSEKQLPPEPLRPPAPNFSHDAWTDFFATASIDENKFQSYCTEVDLLKEEVKEMLVSIFSSTDPMESIKFTNLLWRLGLSYHFEEEIADQLHQIFHGHHPHLLNTNDYDLCSTATAFHVFRHHGFFASSDVFNKFKGSDGKFKESIRSEIMGMLSLYEASHISLPDEEILDEALVFTKAGLEKLLLAADLDDHARTRIINALDQPTHKGIPRLEARKYINSYQHQESRNPTLLKFAKVDYNKLLLQYQKELTGLAKSWKGMDLAGKLPYSKSRLVEFYSCLVAIHFEPHYSLARTGQSKLASVLIFVDDTYDSFGTPEELKLFTQAVERWDYEAADPLPEYMKTLYNALLDTLAELGSHIPPERQAFAVEYTKESLIRDVRAYHKESKWFTDKGDMPKFEEYLSIATITCGAVPTIAMFLLLDNIAGVNEFEWLLNNPRIAEPLCLIVRLGDDISDYKINLQRGEQPISSVPCYMKQHGVSAEEAIGDLKKMIEKAWKTMNEELLRSPNEVSDALLNRVINVVRITEVAFIKNDNDMFYGEQHCEDMLKDLLLKEIP